MIQSNSLNQSQKKYLIRHLMKYRKLFDRVEQSIDKQDQVIIAIDGQSASGKSTFAELLSLLFDSDIIHMDDFYLPKNETKDDQIPVHMNLIEVRNVLDSLKKNESVTYQKFDCSIQKLTEKFTLKSPKIVIVEGAYCLHPVLQEFYDYKIFLSISRVKQWIRLYHRNGFSKLKMFLGTWIPRENQYISHFHIRTLVDENIKF